MAPNEKDLDWLRRMRQVSAQTARESGWSTPGRRRRLRAWVNARRARNGIRPLTVDEDYPPELEFHEKARALGLLRPRLDDA